MFNIYAREGKGGGPAIGWHLPSALNDGFRHEALFYSSDAEFIAGTLPFVSEGCEAGEPVLVAARRERLDLLRLALGSHGHAKSVTFLEFDELGLNPARIIPAWRQFYDECGGANRPIRGIGEPVWADRSRAEVEECRRHEALLNLAFADAEGFWLRCPYDRSTLDPGVVADACCTHPEVSECGASRDSESYPAEDVPLPFAGELSPPGRGSAELGFCSLRPEGGPQLRRLPRALRRPRPAAG